MDLHFSLSEEDMSSQDPNLDAESRQTLNILRRDVWTGGGVGLGIGFLAGLTGYQALQYIPDLRKYRKGKYMTSGVLIMSALGSFLGATVVGKNSVQLHSEVFRKTANPAGSYAKIVHDNRNEELRDMEGSFERRREQLLKKKAELSEKARGF